MRSFSSALPDNQASPTPAATGLPADASDPTRWLADTRQLDLREPRLRITAHKLTQAVQTVPGRLAAIHGFVQRMPFAACLDAGQARASDVLRRHQGDCHAKGLLFTALCRAAGIPARLVFAEVPARFLAGILDEGPAVMPHAIGQAWVDGRWVSTDGYVLDPRLFARAKALVRASGRDCGWGLLAEAQASWNGDGDCLHQVRRADLLRCHAPVDDVAQFYATARPRGLSARLKYLVGAHLVNRRVAALRRHGG